MKIKGAIILCLVLLTCVQAAYSAADDNAGCIKAGCHQKMLDFKYVHGPVAVSDCQSCHKRVGGHKFVPVANGPKLCAACHEVRNDALLGDCGKCHDPHGSDIEFQLLPGAAGKRCTIS
ncbi:MAG: cytochrome c3 family protein [Nitrospirota bacterium]